MTHPIHRDMDRYEALCKRYGIPVNFDRMYAHDDAESLAALNRRRMSES